jgi:hypothetical protein
MIDYDMYVRPKKKQWMDWLPKWTSVVVWLVIMMLVCLNKLNAQNNVDLIDSYVAHEVIKIIGYRVVESDELGCWSELDIFWDNIGMTSEEKELVERKIIQYELYRDDGIEPMINIMRKNKTLQIYHIVKLPSDTFWRN